MSDINWDEIRAEDTEYRGMAEGFLDADMPDEPFTPEDAPIDTPNANVVQDKKRSRTAVEYEKKTAGILSKAFKATVSNPATVADAAAISYHVDKVAKAWGDLADDKPAVRKAFDWLDEGSDNAAFAAAIATLPLVLQLMRNHETALEPQMRGLRVPFTKGKRVFKFRFGFKLSAWVRNNTNEPELLYISAFSDEEMVAALKKRDIKIAPFRTDKRRSTQY